MNTSEKPSVRGLCEIGDSQWGEFVGSIFEFSVTQLDTEWARSPFVSHLFRNSLIRKRRLLPLSEILVAFRQYSQKPVELITQTRMEQLPLTILDRHIEEMINSIQ